MPVPIIVVAAVPVVGMGCKILLDASHRKTREMETGCFVRMKNAGFSEEFIAACRDAWAKDREANAAILRSAIEESGSILSAAERFLRARLAQ